MSSLSSPASTSLLMETFDNPAEIDVAALHSWRGRRIQDGFTEEVGLVIGVTLKDNQPTLLVAFAGESIARPISLERRPDGNYLRPRDRWARYHPA